MATAKKRKVREKTIPVDETAEQRFTRLATARVTAVIKRLRLLKNLAGPSYRFTPEQYQKIAGTLTDELTFVLKAFAARMSTADGTKEEIFSL